MKNVFKVLAIAALMVAGIATEASAQGFLKKLKKAVGTVTNVATDPAGTAVKALTGQSVSGEESEETQQDDEKTSEVEKFLNNPLNFKVSKITKLDDQGNVLKNDDGTEVYRYHIVDQNGTPVNDSLAIKLVDQRLKSINAIILKVGGGAALGALSGGLLGGGDSKTKKKNALAGALTGGVGGLISSAGDIAKIKKVNAALKQCKKLLLLYKQNVTEEGTPIDPSVDLAKLFPDAENVQMKASELDAKLAASKEQLNFDDAANSL